MSTPLVEVLGLHRKFRVGRALPLFWRRREICAVQDAASRFSKARRSVSAERRLFVIEGDPPSPFDLPPGCAFQTRRPLATAECVSTRPELRSVGEPGRLTACHHAETL